MLIESVVVPGILVPMGATLLVLALAALGLRGRPVPQRGQPAVGWAGVGSALAFLSAFVAMTGWPRLPPVEATQKLFYAVALSALAVVALARVRSPVAHGLLSLLVAGSLTVILRTPIEHSWSTSQAALWIGGLSLAAGGIVWGLGRQWAGPEPRPLDRWVRVCLMATIALVLGLSDSARLGQLAGALTVAVATIEGWQLVSGTDRLGSRDAWPPALAISGLLVIGHFYAGLTLLGLGAVVLSIVLLGLTARRGWLQLVALAPAALIAGGLVVDFVNAPEDPYAGYGDSASDSGRDPGVGSPVRRSPPVDPSAG